MIHHLLMEMAEGGCLVAWLVKSIAINDRLWLDISCQQSAEQHITRILSWRLRSSCSYTLRLEILVLIVGDDFA